MDLLLSQSEVETVHKRLHQEFYAPKVSEDDSKLFSDVTVYTLSPTEYLPLFTAELPLGGYSTMVVSTGGHWTTGVFSGLANDAHIRTSPHEDDMEEEGQRVEGIDRVIDLFRESMTVWAGAVQDAVEGAGQREPRSPEREKHVLVRAYLPGHEDCHDFRAPWTEIKPFVWGWYNWARIWEFNDVFEVRRGVGDTSCD